MILQLPTPHHIKRRDFVWVLDDAGMPYLDLFFAVPYRPS